MKHKSIAAVIAAMLFLGICSVGQVSAHAELDRSNPKAGSTVQGSPAQVEIWFTEEIAEGSAIAVVDAAGKPATTAEAKLDLFDPDRKHLTVELAPNLPNGVYTVNWTSISAEDGDTESDSFTFTIAGGGTSEGDSSPELDDVGRVTSVIAGVLVIGAVVVSPAPSSPQPTTLPATIKPTIQVRIAQPSSER